MPSGRAIFASALCAVVGALAFKAWAMAEVSEEDLSRFEQLKQAKILSCELRTWHVKLKQKQPTGRSTAAEWVVEEQESVPGDHLFVIFDQQKTRAILLTADLEQDKLERGWTATAKVKSVDPAPAAFAVLGGALRLRAPADRPSEHCKEFPQRECFPDIQISADPQYLSFFPMLLTLFVDVKANIITAGFCKPRLPDDVSRRLSSFREQELCTGNADSIGKWSIALGAAYLLTGDVKERYNVNAYKSFKIAWNSFAAINVPEDTDQARRDRIIRQKEISAFDARAAMAIAAEGMTPEQIAEAERLAAAWEPDPKRCPAQPTAESSEKKL